MIGRVRDRATFEALRRDGQRARRGPVTVVYLPGDAPPPRAAFAVGRKVGNAVVRNRVRRRMRAILGEMDSVATPSALRPGTYLVAALEGIADVSFEDLRRHLSAACDAASGSDGRP